MADPNNNMPEMPTNDAAMQANQQFMRMQQAAQQSNSTKSPTQNTMELLPKSVIYGAADGTFVHMLVHLPFIGKFFNELTTSEESEYDSGGQKATPLQDTQAFQGLDTHGGVLSSILQYFTRDFNMGEAPSSGEAAGDATAGIQQAESGGAPVDTSGGGSASSGTGDIQALNFGGATMVDTHVNIEAPRVSAVEGIKSSRGGGGDGGGFSLG